jgi:hypothetical protein
MAGTCAHTCTDSKPQPTTRTVLPVIVAPAKKYDADEASPSTNTVPGDRYGCCPGMCSFWRPSRRFTETPNFSMSLIVMSTYGLDTSSPSMLISTPCICGASAWA